MRPGSCGSRCIMRVALRGFTVGMREYFETCCHLVALAWRAD